VIKCPIAGVVMQLPVRQGMYVQPATTVASIMDLGVLFRAVQASFGATGADH